MSAPRSRTHRMGAKCSKCDEVLVADSCPCGVEHGYGFQEANDWAARTWPNHPCFKESTS